MAQYAHLSEMDAEISAAVAQMPELPPFDNIAVTRQFIEKLLGVSRAAREAALPPKSAYKVQDYAVPVTEGEITVRSIVPVSEAGNEGDFPLLVWLHGGGWTLGNIDMDDLWLRLFSVALKISVVNVDYRLAPEFPFPTGLNDCYAALKWVADNSGLLDASLGKGFIVAGSSAGANLAAAVALRARDDAFFKDRPLTGQLLEIPATIHPMAYPEKYKSELLSMEQNKVTPTIRADTHLKGLLELVKAPPTDPDFSVVLNPSHAGLPPTYFQICGLDPLRDEGFLYEKLLREAGVKTKIDVYPGLPHAGHVFFPQLSVSAKFEADSKQGLIWLLKGGA